MVWWWWRWWSNNIIPRWRQRRLTTACIILTKNTEPFWVQWRTLSCLIFIHFRRLASHRVCCCFFFFLFCSHIWWIFLPLPLLVLMMMSLASCSVRWCHRWQPTHRRRRRRRNRSHSRCRYVMLMPAALASAPHKNTALLLIYVHGHYSRQIKKAHGMHQWRSPIEFFRCARGPWGCPWQCVLCVSVCGYPGWSTHLFVDECVAVCDKWIWTTGHQ